MTYTQIATQAVPGSKALERSIGLEQRERERSTAPWDKDHFRELTNLRCLRETEAMFIVWKIQGTGREEDLKNDLANLLQAAYWG